MIAAESKYMGLVLISKYQEFQHHYDCTIDSHTGCLHPQGKSDRGYRVDCHFMCNFQREN